MTGSRSAYFRERKAHFKLTVNQWHSRSISAASADSRKIAFQELRASDFQTFFDYLGRKLVHTVVHSKMKNMLDSAAFVVRSAMLTNMLNAPVAELTMCKDVHLPQNFFNGESLLAVSTRSNSKSYSLSKKASAEQCRDWIFWHYIISLTFSSSTQFSKMFWTTRLPVSPKATSCHIPRNASFTLAMTWGGSPLHRSSNNFCQTWHAYR